MEEQIIINVIIPCYYSSDIIRKCFESLAIQTAKNHLQIYMINDCSPNTICDYQDIRDEFSNQLNIIYLKTKKNSGPGVARQLGLDSIHNNAKYVLFIDDDDQLPNQFIIENYLNALNQCSNKNNIIGAINGIYQLESVQGTCQIGLNNTLFNLEIIQNFHISFPPLYYEEDNTFVYLYSYILQYLNNYTKNIIIKNLNKITYLHINNNNSLTNRQDYIKFRKSQSVNRFLFICNYFIKYSIIDKYSKYYLETYKVFDYMFLEVYNYIIDYNIDLNFTSNLYNLIKLYELEFYSLDFNLHKIKNKDITIFNYLNLYETELKDKKGDYMNIFNLPINITKEEINNLYKLQVNHEHIGNLINFLLNQNLQQNENYLRLWTEYMDNYYNLKNARMHFHQIIKPYLLEHDYNKYYIDFDKGEIYFDDEIYKRTTQILS